MTQSEFERLPVGFSSRSGLRNNGARLIFFSAALAPSQTRGRNRRGQLCEEPTLPHPSFSRRKGKKKPAHGA